MTVEENDLVVEFFAGLAERGHVHPLRRCTGSVRFDIVSPAAVDHWRVEIAKGDVTVARDAGPADAVVRADKAVIEGLLRGEVNAVAATLRGVVVVEGDWDLVLMSQRLFAGAALAADREEMTR
jgi:putative sterol carrier protein